MRDPGSEADLISEGESVRRDRFVGSRITDPGASQPNKIQLNLLIPAIPRPQIERCACNFIDQGNGDTETCEVDTLQIVTARLARVHAEMVERWRVKVSKLVLVLFAAMGAQHATEGPHGEACR